MSEHINTVKPFKALHYNPEKIENIGDCLSEPYDVISPAQQDAYYKKHPNNVIRLILGKIEDSDTDTDNRYTRARDFMQKWKAGGILTQSTHPWFFVYEESFAVNGKDMTLTGFVGLVHLSEYKEGKVLPHEKVLKNPVEDRVKLTETANTQFEYIWGVYRDPESTIDAILAAVKKSGPIIDHIEQETGVRHKVWGLSDPDLCSTIENTMRSKKIYIADGHHRYQTMLTIRDRKRKENPAAGDNAPWEFIMMFLVNAAHEGLEILPTHRVIYNLPDDKIKKLRTSLSEYFTVLEYPFSDPEYDAVQKKLTAELALRKQPSFGVLFQNENVFFLIELKDRKGYFSMCNPNSTDTWKLLDVNVLNTLVLSHITGISEDDMAAGTNVVYIKDAAEACQLVRSGGKQIAFILNNTPLDAMLAVSDSEEKMPRKSTYFYPKPMSGMVFYEMTETN
ncbi:MAG: DUF1015 domain-containing protein [Spirochaetales bacterium]|nr:DUF1015 domain-containing protein [Spirochaetales bacterium]